MIVYNLAVISQPGLLKIPKFRNKINNNNNNNNRKEKNGIRNKKMWIFYPL